MPLSRLNKEQYQAATAPLGNSLIIASAGTGKTSTIVARISHLLNLGIKPEKILLLTFTNKASIEMIERLNKHFSKSVTSKILAGTFHSVSYTLLKALEKNLTLKQPNELKILLKSVVDRRKFDHISEVKPYSGAYLYDVYSLFQNKVATGEFYEWFCKNYQDQAVYAEIYEDILKEFEEEKKNFGYVDFNDLLIKMRNELRKGAPVHFEEVLVDEYQDTNTLQSSLIDAINKKSLFCVGDFDQSIYAFNGANIEIIGGFKDNYKNAQIYTLNTNYRSSSSILSLANKVISNNPRLYEKNLSVSREGKFKPPTLLVYEELFAQYANISEIICSSKIQHENIAIIFRNNSSADGLEVALKEKGIKSKRKGGVSFFESREIKALVDIISIFVNPKDVMAFINLFEYAKGVGNAQSKKIFDLLLKLGHGSIVNGILNPDTTVSLKTGKVQNKQLGLFDEIDEFSDKTRFNKFNFDDKFKSNPILEDAKLSESGAVFLYELKQCFLDLLSSNNAFNAITTIIKSKIYTIIVELLSTKRATLKNGNIDENLKQEAKDRIYSKTQVLVELSKTYTSIDKLYNFITLGSKEMSEGEGINLLTIHASKGLEFDLVFVVDLAQNRFPNLKLMNMSGSLEEERRLFYVAVTRARDELYLSYAKFDKIRKIEYKPSQFLIEAGLVKEF